LKSRLIEGELMKHVKMLIAILGVAFLAVQFIRPAKNRSQPPPGSRMESGFHVPEHVMQVFRRSCFDCHSDSTVYPWYAEIQPVGWWLNSHIQDGKRQFDFDRFASYRPMRQYGKFKDLVQQLQQDEMPLGSYLFIHRYARLTSDEKEDPLERCDDGFDAGTVSDRQPGEEEDGWAKRQVRSQKVSSQKNQREC
jgi:hypothetical protein